MSDAKLHCRALSDVPDEDPILTTYIRGARQLIEERTSRALVTQTWKLEQDWFTDEIWLPRAAPLQSVTSVKYYDIDGVQQTLATSVYRVDTTSTPGRIVPKPGQSWPSVQSERGQAVEVIYVCGWSNADSVPEALRIGVLLLVDHLYENRSAVQVGVGIGAVEIPMGVQACVGPYEVYWREPMCA